MKRVLFFALLLGSFNDIFAQKTDRIQAREARRWVRSGIWAPEGLEMELHPTVDFVEFKKQYLANRNLWDQAFKAILKADKNLSSFTEYGKKEIVKERCHMTVSEYTPKSADNVRLEGHQNFIDIQISTGTVLWGTSTVEDSKVVVPYNRQTDNAFYRSEKVKIVKQKASKPYIFIFFPKDLHIPAYAKTGVDYDTQLKKVVVKIENVMHP
ncbi:MAG: YhcH/YjgK/YiaL family protein [Bacteroidales bacterium]|nr:YhcH/YjgK/YiaL family protein [Bacteroidales bacterium]MDD5714277.1 YhcH/YjgK/YiaL family protein [Bacteroidales bacterium]